MFLCLNDDDEEGVGRREREVEKPGRCELINEELDGEVERGVGIWKSEWGLDGQLDGS